ncbi:hypothetical protein TKK_0000242 [Trichogramma kaykai]
MLNRDIEYIENDGFDRHEIFFYKANDIPAVVSTLKPARGQKFGESLTFSFFKNVFLPQGFPESVHKDYVAYQIWDTLQAFASTINGTLTTHSIMRGVGVGESSATPLAAAITWIMKDGTGMIGRIIFAWWQGNNLDSQCKKWRLFADILNDVAMSIEVMLPYLSSSFLSYSLYTLCLTTGMKAIVGIAGGATRVAIMQHHAIKDNMADVSAKEHSQGTLVNLAGSIVGILILLVVPEKLFIYLCFILVIVHVISNYYGVTSLEINTLNEDRLCLVIEDFLIDQSISRVEDINKRESVFLFLEKPSKKFFGFNIEIGGSLQQVLQWGLIQSQDVWCLLNLFQTRKFLPVVNLKTRKIYIILTEDVNDTDILKAYFHSCIYALMICQIKNLRCEALTKMQWSGSSYVNHNKVQEIATRLNDDELVVPGELVLALDQIALQEYNSFTKVLNESDWIVKSNMLPVKQWRGTWR